jgi:hypothetical protein
MENMTQGSEQEINTTIEQPTEHTGEQQTNQTNDNTSSTPSSDYPSESASSSNNLDEPEYLKKRLGKQARQHIKEKEELERNYERRLQEIQYRQQNNYANEAAPQEDIDLSNPNHLLAAVDELVNQRLIEKEKQSSQQAITRKIQNFVDSAREKYSDFDALAEQYKYAPEGFAEAIPLLKNADDVMYQVLKDPKEYNNLLNKSPAEVIHRLTEISYHLSSRNTVSKAPPPIRPLTASGSPMNLTKSCKERRAELREEYRGRSRRK